MHSVATSVKRQRQTPKSRAEGARGGRPIGSKVEIRDAEAYYEFLKSLGPGSHERWGDLELAAAKIRAVHTPDLLSTLCHRSTLWRHVKHLEDGKPAKITCVLLAQMQRAAEREGPATLRVFHRATMSEIAQERMRRYFQWLESFLPYWSLSMAYQMAERAVFARYNYPGRVIWTFREWMRNEGIRPSVQKIAIWRILAPLTGHQDSAGIELTWREFIDHDDDDPAREDDSALIRFLEAGVAWQKEYLLRRGHEIDRAHRSTVIPAPNGSESPSTERSLSAMS
jgi:hypothetical protein